MNNIYVKLELAKDKKHKYIAKVHTGGKIHNIKFGQFGASDFTLHKNNERMWRYLFRHKKEMNKGLWDFNNPLNYLTKSFWSRWLLWSKPSLQEAMNNIQNNTNIIFI